MDKSNLMKYPIQSFWNWSHLFSAKKIYLW